MFKSVRTQTQRERERERDAPFRGFDRRLSSFSGWRADRARANACLIRCLPSPPRAEARSILTKPDTWRVDAEAQQQAHTHYPRTDDSRPDARVDAVPHNNTRVFDFGFIRECPSLFPRALRLIVRARARASDKPEPRHPRSTRLLLPARYSSNAMGESKPVSFFRGAFKTPKRNFSLRS